MAPTITAVEFTFRPMDAIRIASIRIHILDPWILVFSSIIVLISPYGIMSPRRSSKFRKNCLAGPACPAPRSSAASFIFPFLSVSSYPGSCRAPFYRFSPVSAKRDRRQPPEAVPAGSSPFTRDADFCASAASRAESPLLPARKQTAKTGPAKSGDRRKPPPRGAVPFARRVKTSGKPAEEAHVSFPIF